MAVCNPSEVLSDAKCFSCLSPKSLAIAQTELLFQIGGGPTPPPPGGGDMLFEDGDDMLFEDGEEMLFES